jgi:hypothetical protein
MNSSWVIIQMASPSASVPGSASRLEGPLTPAGDPGQEEHNLSYNREIR